MGQIITFYSFKGGVGRTMALANVAVLLAQWGFKTLIVDWDLEAPGLEQYFQNYIDRNELVRTKGIADILYEVQSEKNKPELDWRDLIIKVRLPNSVGSLHLIRAGKQDADYFKRVRAFDIDTFYADHDGGEFIDKLRHEWLDDYDFVLIDSRTGVTDIGGICTVQLPDIVVVVLVANEQNTRGILEVISRIKAARQRLIQPRFNLIYIPVPSRFDNSEFKQSQNWLERFSEEFNDVYKNWLPENISSSSSLNVQLLELMKLPYVAYFSYGEKLAALETRRTDSTSLGYAYETLASVLANEVENVALLLNNRDTFIETAKRRTKKGTSSIDKDTQRRLFISYSHRDEKWYQKILLHLSPVLRNTEIIVFDDSIVRPGEDWRAAIEKAVTTSDMILILASPDYLASDYIQEQELPHLLRRAEENNAVILWVALSPAMYRESELKYYQSVNNPDRPLSSLSQTEQELQIMNITRKVTDLIKSQKLYRH